MTNEQALEQLKSASPHARLKAARYLARWAEAKDLPILSIAQLSEADFLIQGSLKRAIDRLTQAPLTQAFDFTDEVEVSDQLRRQIYARATEWIAGLLLHEISPQIGMLAYESSQEVPDYEHSKTSMRVRALQMIFDAIAHLLKASATPKPIEIDLSNLISEIVATEFESFSERIALHGPTPLLLVSDPALLQFSICNGLRNAVEAISSVVDQEAGVIVIAWGETDVDYWISIIDKGPGMTKPLESLSGIGSTTKEGHTGFGLSIAAAAMEALGGVIRLESAIGGGAKFELRWEK